MADGEGGEAGHGAASRAPQLTIVVSAIEPKLLINMLQVTFTGGPAGGGDKSHSGTCVSEAARTRWRRTYHSGLCDRAKAVDKNIACNIYRGTCEMEWEWDDELKENSFALEQWYILVTENSGK